MKGLNRCEALAVLLGLGTLVIRSGLVFVLLLRQKMTVDELTIATDVMKRSKN